MNIKPILAVSFYLSACSNSWATEQDNNTFTVFGYSNSYSDYLPIIDLIDSELDTKPKKGASEAFSLTTVGARYRYKSVQLSLQHKTDYWGDINDDAAEFIYLEQNRLPFDGQDEYNLALNVTHQRSDGVSLGYYFDVADWELMVEVGYWNINVVRESNLRGTVYSGGGRDLSGAVEFYEHYTRKNVLRRPYQGWNQNGNGVNANVHLRGKITDNWHLEVKLNDIYSDFEIDQLAYTEGAINTDNSFITSEGTQSFLPLFKGQEATRTHSFELPKNLSFDLTYDTGAVDYSAVVTRQGNINFLWLGIGVDYLGLNWSASIDVEHATPQIALESEHLKMYFATDEIDLYNAMQVHAGLEYKLSW